MRFNRRGSASGIRRVLGIALIVAVFALPFFCTGAKKIPGIAKAALKIRALPTIGSQHLATVEKGRALTVIAEGPLDTIEKITKHWLKVESVAGAGWVFGGFVETSAEISGLTKKRYKFSKTRKLYIYEKADAQSRKLGVLPFGSILDDEQLTPVPNGGKLPTWYSWRPVQGFILAGALSDQAPPLRADKLVFTAKSSGEHDAAAGGDEEVYEFYNGVCIIRGKSDGRGYNVHQVRDIMLEGYYTVENGKIVCAVTGREKLTYCNGPEDAEQCESSEKKIELRKELLFKPELAGYIRAEDQVYLRGGKVDHKACTVSGSDGMNGTGMAWYWCP